MVKRTIASTKLGDEDELVMVQQCDTMDYLVLQSKGGYFLRFLKEEGSREEKSGCGRESHEADGRG